MIENNVKQTLWMRSINKIKRENQLNENKQPKKKLKKPHENGSVFSINI